MFNNKYFQKKRNYDKVANNSPTLIYDIENKKFIEKKWSDINVGSFIKIQKNEILPADILIIKSSDDSGLCYLETTNLDGESALKPRQAIIHYHNLIHNEEKISEIYDQIELDLPNNHIYKVEGTIFYKNTPDKREFFSIDNVLLRVNLFY